MKKKIRIWVFSLMQQIGAVPQLRIVIPFSYLPQDEFEFVHTPSLKAILKLFNIPQVIIFHRDAYPLRGINRIIKFVCSRGIVTVLDMDDLLTHLPAPHPIYSYYQKIKLSLIESLKAVDIVTVTNNRLKEHCQRYNPSVYVLSNFLDEQIWNSNGLKRKRDDKIVIGYAGSSTHVYDFKIVTPAIKYILSKYNGKVCFKFIGCIPTELQTMSGVEYISQLVSYKEYANTLMNSNFDFAIAPLEGNVFNHCKSNIKFLEYSICGYAGIYSAVGPYIDSIVPNETGVLVKNTTNEWIRAMELLINNPELRHTLGRNAFQHVKTNYTHKEKSKEWYKFYSQIATAFQKKKSTQKLSISLLSSYSYFLVYAQILNIYYKIQKQLSLFSLPIVEKRKWTVAGKDILREEFKKQVFPSHSRVLLLRGPESGMVNDVCDVLKEIYPQAEIVMLVGDERRIEKFKGGILDLPYQGKIGYFFKLWSRIFKKFDLILILRKDAFFKKFMALASFSRASFTINNVGRLEKVGILSIFRKK